MRYMLTSFLALHWAAAFALLAFLCIDGSRGVAAALGVLGVPIQDALLVGFENAIVVAPLAVALLMVAVLFCWALVEGLISGAPDPQAPDSVLRTAFLSACGVLSLGLIGGAAQGINGLFMAVAVQLTALLASYVAMLAERRAVLATAIPARADIRAAAHVMATDAAHSSLLSRISGRSDLKPRDGR